MRNPFEVQRSPVDRSGASDGDRLEKRGATEELRAGASLPTVLDFSDRLTRYRNESFLGDVGARIEHLGIGGGEMLDSVMRVAPDKMKAIVPVVAAKVLLRVVSVLQGLENREGIIKALIQKYPESGCSYCGHKPCQCGVIRPEEKVGAQSSAAQQTWTIKQWQGHLKSVYGENNSKHGLLWITARLASEIAEVTKAHMLAGQSQQDAMERYLEEAVSESADVFAWVAAVCNEVDADLEKMFIDRYGNGCPICGQMPCKCGPFNYIEERKR